MGSHASCLLISSNVISLHQPLIGSWSAISPILSIADGTNMYLATVIDCYSRMLVGFAIADHMRTELVEEALEHAQTTRGSVA